jgi:GntR family transcriptional regulator of arabinose operon
MDFQYPYIVEDDTQAGYLAAKHLIDLGHKKIGGIFKIDDIQGHYRFSGFQKACNKAGLQVDVSLIMWFETNDLDIKFDNRNPQLEKLLYGCTAIVCYNDQIALKIMDIMRAKNLRVPEDISLVSFDDSQLAVASEIKLTTVAHPKDKLGEEAAKAIIDMVERKQDYCGLKFKPELVVRNSTQEFPNSSSAKD